MKKKQKPPKSILLRILVIGVAAYMIVTLSGLWRELAAKRAELASVQRQFDAQQAEIAEIRALLQTGNERALIEQAAYRLGYVYVDEEVYVDISGN